MSEKWTAADIPDQSGRVAVVTGANSGLGLVAARELARAGAHVVLACRNTEQGRGRRGAIRGRRARARPRSRRSTSPTSPRCATSPTSFAHERDGLDLLINNAGVMAPPRRTTADGFELQFGTNHLGHFALTGLLLGAAAGPRRRAGRHASAAARTASAASTSTTSSASASTAAGAPTGSRSSPTCCSPSSSTAACAPPARRVTQRRRPPRLRRHQPAVGRAAAARPAGHGGLQPAVAQSAEMGALPRSTRPPSPTSRAAPTSAPTAS